MKRRTALKTAGASLLAGTALTTSGTATGDGPTVVSVESDTTTDTDGSEKYSVEYLGDGVVEITGTATAPDPCHEVSVNGVHQSKYGDVVDLSLESGSGFCITVLAQISYTVRLEYDNEVPDVIVSTPDGAGDSGR